MPPKAKSPAVKVAEADVVLVIVVGIRVPFRVTKENWLTNPEPASVIVVPVPPAWTLVGVIEVIVGIGSKTFRATWFDKPPPGAGLTTAICSVPGAARSLPEIAARSEVGPLNVVATFAPFNVTTDCGTKFVPVRKTVTLAEVSARVLDGLMDVRCGTGLSAGVMINGNVILVWFAGG